MQLLERFAAAQKPAEHLRGGLLREYAEAAGAEGYAVEAGGNAGLFLVRGEEKIAVEVQFGNRYELLQSMKRLYESRAGLCILATSSLVRAVRFGELGKILLENFAIGARKFAFIDVESGKILRVNFGQLPKPAQPRPQEQRGQPQKQLQPAQSRPEKEQQKQAPSSYPRREGRRKKIVHGRRGEHKEQD